MDKKDITLRTGKSDSSISIKVKSFLDDIKLKISATDSELYLQEFKKYLNSVTEKVTDCRNILSSVNQIFGRCTDLENNLEEFCYEELNNHAEDSNNPHFVTAEQVNAYTKSETDTLLDEKQPVGNYLTEHQSLNNYYTKSEVDTGLGGKSDTNHTHSQYLTSHQDISGKADIADLPTKLSDLTDDLGSSPTHTHSQYLTSHQDISGKADVNHTHSQYLTSHQSLSNYYTKSETYSQSEVDSIAAQIEAGQATLADVALSGDYDDLINKPTIPDAQIQADWNQSTTTAKDYIKNKPTIPTVPTNVSSFTNDAGYLTSHQDISGKADTNLSNVSSNITSIPPTSLTNFDGSWTASSKSLSTSTAVNTYEVSLANYLPNDNYSYEVYVSVMANRSGSGNAAVFAGSDILAVGDASDGKMLMAVCGGGSADGSSRSVPVGSGRKIIIKITSNALSYLYAYALAYRRIGTNQ